jgi:hypothetical protein
MASWVLSCWSVLGALPTNINTHHGGVPLETPDSIPL